MVVWSLDFTLESRRSESEVRGLIGARVFPTRVRLRDFDYLRLGPLP